MTLALLYKMGSQWIITISAHKPLEIKHSKWLWKNDHNSEIQIYHLKRSLLWLIYNFEIKLTYKKGAAVAEWLSSWLAEQEDRGSIPRLATWIFRDWLSPASKSRYGWKIAKSTLKKQPTNQLHTKRTSWKMNTSNTRISKEFSMSQANDLAKHNPAVALVWVLSFFSFVSEWDRLLNVTCNDKSVINVTVYMLNGRHWK